MSSSDMRVFGIEKKGCEGFLNTYSLSSLKARFDQTSI